MDLQATINAAASGDAIIAQGTCEGSFSILKDLSILGFFSVTLDATSSAATVLSIRNGSTVVIERAIIRGAQHGRGVAVSDGSNVTLRDVEVADNRRPPPQVSRFGDGGGISAGPGSFVLIEDSWIHDNVAHGVGGGIFNNGSITLRDSVVESNRGGGGVGGGGIYNGGSGWIEISDTIIHDNRSDLGVGGLWNGGLVTMVRTSLTDHSGGGIGNRGTLVANGVTIARNIAGYQGRRGGGLWNEEDGVAFLTNSTLAENGATLGGGIYNEGDLTLWESTVSDNIAYSQFASNPAEGGGLWNGGDASVKSSIISGNDKYPNGDCAGTVMLDSRGGNVLGPDCQVAASATADTFVADPVLDSLGPNGGPTDTMAPLPNSPIVDAGSCINSTDQRGVARPQNGKCDSGSYENRLPSNAGTPMLSDGSTSPNRGKFHLSWNPASDPDGDSIKYRLQVMYADDADWQTFSFLFTEPTYFLVGRREGTSRYRVAATDGNFFSQPSAPSLPIVVDRTPPALPAIMTDRAAEHVDPSSGQAWFRDVVEVAVTPGVDPPLPDGSPGSGTVSTPWSVTYNTGGPHTTSDVSTDAAGNSSAEQSLTVYVDTVDPSVAFDECPATVFLDNVVEIPWSASDSGVGLSGPGSGTEQADTSALGPTTTTVVVSDLVGHQASDDCASQVIFDFQGFEPPLASQNGSVELKAGKEFRVAFSLNGFQGDDVIEAGSVLWTPMSCDTGEALGAPGAAIIARDILYNDRFDEYWLVVATEKDRRQTCARFELTLIDGVSHGVDVIFK